MTSQLEIVRGQIGPSLIQKADRLFCNDMRGIWIELLQNSRRAGATRVDIIVEEQSPDSGHCDITVQDNGRGIEHFQNLLTLGDSGWDEHTQSKEDPAGMGFFALCRGVVEVQSGQRSLTITPAVFLGKDHAVVETTATFVLGTRIRFSRESTRSFIEQELTRAAEFCPVEVFLNGEAVERGDFLEGALYRETIDGIEVGFAVDFVRGRHTDANWNFYGARIHHDRMAFAGFLAPGSFERRLIFARFNVLETGRVKLQLPDRKGIIEDDFYKEFMRKMRAAAYRFFQRQERHALPFANWKEASELGIILPEAAHLLTTWHATPADDNLDPLFDRSERNFLSDERAVVLVEDGLPYAHTLEGALHSNNGAVIPGELFRENKDFKGYKWYDALRRIISVEPILDGIAYEDWDESLGRPSELHLDITIAESNHDDRVLQLPAFIHVDSDVSFCDGLYFVAVKNSPWDNPGLHGPFPVLDFLVNATFSSSDDPDADSWYTQRDRYEDEVQREINEYFRGPKATLLALLQQGISHQASKLAKRLGVTHIHFNCNDTGAWTVELVNEPKPSEARADEDLADTGSPSAD